MSDIAAQFNTMLIKSGFQEMPPNGKFSPIGNFYCLPKSFGEGIYWIYGEKNLFNIKIHDFYFYTRLFRCRSWWKFRSPLLPDRHR